MESQDFFGYDRDMKLILFRHAEKSAEKSYDPPLSPYGFLQSKKLAQEIFSKKFPHPNAFYVSSRIRTHQTFAEAAKMLGLKLKISTLLDEKQVNEKSSDFRRRIQELLVNLQLDYPGKECVYLCTHFDWIEEFLSVIECSTDLLQAKYHSWAPAQWMSFEKSELWDLENFSQVQA